MWVIRTLVTLGYALDATHENVTNGTIVTIVILVTLLLYFMQCVNM